jgi:hypothetical protein
MVPQVSLTPHSLLGTSEESLTLPLPNRGSLDVGPVTVTLDHRRDERVGGVADLMSGGFRAGIMLQATAPGLYDLVTAHGLDPKVVGPMRVLSRWEGRYTPEGRLEAQCDLEVLEGSIWEGTTGRTVCSGVCGDCGTVQGDQPILKLMELLGSADDSTSAGVLIYMACPCRFELTFPPQLEGTSAVVTIKGVLLFRATPDTTPSPLPAGTVRLPVLES